GRCGLRGRRHAGPRPRRLRHVHGPGAGLAAVGLGGSRRCDGSRQGPVGPGLRGAPAGTLIRTRRRSVVGLLDGKVAVVTGAAQGIGLAVARAYVEHGASVALIDVASDSVERAAATIADSGGSAIPVVADGTDPEAMEAAATLAVER